MFVFPRSVASLRAGPVFSVELFLPDENTKRIRALESVERIVMEQTPADLFIKACKMAVKVSWGSVSSYRLLLVLVLLSPAVVVEGLGYCSHVLLRQAVCLTVGAHELPSETEQFSSPEWTRPHQQMVSVDVFAFGTAVFLCFGSVMHLLQLDVAYLPTGSKKSCRTRT